MDKVVRPFLAQDNVAGFLESCMTLFRPLKNRTMPKKGGNRYLQLTGILDGLEGGIQSVPILD
jgi:hypothetical protein